MQKFFIVVYSEYRYSQNGTVTFFDLFAIQDRFALACEIETTSRHGVDNAIKAAAVDVPLWIIVPTNRVRATLSRKLKSLQLRPGGEPIKILLMGQLQGQLQDYLSLKPISNQHADISVLSTSKGEN